jgi:antitoxin component YwqK of YwqJK toxin-antitoxin module
LNGTSTTWHPNGQIASVSEYLEDLLNGQELEYYSSGRIMHKGNYKYDVPNGIYELYGDTAGFALKIKALHKTELINDGILKINSSVDYVAVYSNDGEIIREKHPKSSWREKQIKLRKRRKR